MKKVNIISAIIMGAILVLSELHTFWERSTITGSWIIRYPFSAPMTLQNYIHDNCVMLNWILISVYAYRLAKHPTKFSIWLLQLFIVWKIINIPFYWYNYRTFGYHWVYVFLIVVGAISYKKWNGK